MKGLLGKKLGMLQIWDENGRRIGVTALHVGPCYILQVKNQERDGYSSVQIGFDGVDEKSSRINKGMMGQQKQAFENSGKYYARVLEVRDPVGEMIAGDSIGADIFEVGERVMVQASSKGKGFQGVVKRYNFAGGRKTHGSHFHRSPGSVGAGTDPARVIKGKKMPGRMGGKKVTIKNLRVVQVDVAENIVLVEGAVPGPNGANVFVYQK